MPELPEVETVRRQLTPAMAGRQIVGVEVRQRKSVMTPRDPAGGFSHQRRSGPAPSNPPARLTKRDLLLGGRVDAIHRHGKQLAIEAEDHRAICVHLGMTGQMLHARNPELDRHVHVVWRLEDGTSVLFRDARRFGGVWTFPTLEELVSRRWAGLGADAASVTTDELRRGLGRTRRAVKAALLDQRVIAGVGNIYADEALHRAGVHPETPGGALSATQSRDLARSLRTVLRAAIQGRGTTLSDYRTPQGKRGTFRVRLRVYGRAGEACVGCGHALDSAIVGQRTTVWCPVCQPLL